MYRKRHEYSEDGIKNLSNAIVMTAYVDLMLGYAGLFIPKATARKEIARSEQFFKSEYFRTICHLDGEALIKKAKEEARRNKMIYMPVKDGKVYYMAHKDDKKTPLSDERWDTVMECAAVCAKKQNTHWEIYKRLLNMMGGDRGGSVVKESTRTDA